MTLTVTSFNATAGKVNVTLTDSSMEFLLSGESSINHVSSSSSPPPPLSSSRYLCMSLPFILRVPHVNQSITKWSHAWEWKLTIGSKDGCISLRWLTNCPLKSHSSPPLLLQPFSHLFWSFLTASHLSCFSLFSPLTSHCFFLFFYHSPALIFSRLFIHIILILPLVLYLIGVYKRQEARLMLLLYQMRALAHSSLSRITDETWAMDGFVSIHRNLKQLASDLMKITHRLFFSLFYYYLLCLTDK